MIRYEARIVAGPDRKPGKNRIVVAKPRLCLHLGSVGVNLQQPESRRSAGCLIYQSSYFGG
jgi:hypothetical protein